MTPRLRTFKIITDRLVIRCYTETDAPLLKQSIDESIEHLKLWMPWIENEPETIEAKTQRLKVFRERFERGEDFTFGIFNRLETEIVGSSGFHNRIQGNALEIGYWVNVNHLRKGIAIETVNALTKIGFEIENLDRIEIHCDVLNTHSAKIPERCRYYHKETRKGDRKDRNGAPSDTMIWEIDRERYLLHPLEIPLQAFNIRGELIMG